MNSKEECLDCTKCNERSEIFKDLSQEELRVIDQDRYNAGYKPGETIFKQKSPASHMVVVTSGLAKTYLEGSAKGDIILNYVKPFEFIIGPGMFRDGKQYFSAVAIEDTVCCFVSVENMRKVMHGNPHFAEKLLGYCSSRSVFLYERLVSLTQKQMHGRVADALLFMYKKVYSGQDELPLPRQDLADLTCMSKDSAIRVLKEFEKDKLISLNGKSVKILDMTRLVKLSQIG